MKLLVFSLGVFLTFASVFMYYGIRGSEVPLYLLAMVATGVFFIVITVTVFVYPFAKLLYSLKFQMKKPQLSDKQINR